MTVKGNHKLAEIIACKLSGIESVPIKHVGKMVNNACRAAVEYHEAAVKNAQIELLEDIKLRAQMFDGMFPLADIIHKIKELNND